jgi:hypothetical protein
MKPKLRSWRVRFWVWLASVFNMGHYVRWDVMTSDRRREDAGLSRLSPRYECPHLN